MCQSVRRVCVCACTQKPARSARKPTGIIALCERERDTERERGRVVSDGRVRQCVLYCMWRTSEKVRIAHMVNGRTRAAHRGLATSADSTAGQFRGRSRLSSCSISSNDHAHTARERYVNTTNTANARQFGAKTQKKLPFNWVHITDRGSTGAVLKNPSAPPVDLDTFPT